MFIQPQFIFVLSAAFLFECPLVDREALFFSSSLLSFLYVCGEGRREEQDDRYKADGRNISSRKVDFTSDLKKKDKHLYFDNRQEKIQLIMSMYFWIKISDKSDLNVEVGEEDRKTDHVNDLEVEPTEGHTTRPDDGTQGLQHC